MYMKTPVVPVYHRLLSDEERKLFTEILNADTEYQDNELFSKPNCHIQLFKEQVDMTEAEKIWHKLFSSSPSIIDATVKSDHKYLFTKEEEVQTFLQMNYARRAVDKLKKRYHEKKFLSLAEYRRCFYWYAVFRERYNTICVANLGIVSACAKRMAIFRRPNSEIEEIIGDMNDGLLRSIDKFNVARGFKFSTYVWRAVWLRASRACQRINKQKAVFFSSAFEEQFDPSDTSQKELVENREMIEHVRDLVLSNKANLSDVELSVIRHRFGFDGEAETLDNIGKKHKVSKERIRQIQNHALNKLRECMENN